MKLGLESVLNIEIETISNMIIKHSASVEERRSDLKFVEESRKSFAKEISLMELFAHFDRIKGSIFWQYSPIYLLKNVDKKYTALHEFYNKLEVETFDYNHFHLLLSEKCKRLDLPQKQPPLAKILCNDWAFNFHDKSNQYLLIYIVENEDISYGRELSDTYYNNKHKIVVIKDKLEIVFQGGFTESGRIGNTSIGFTDIFGFKPGNWILLIIEILKGLQLEINEIEELEKEYRKKQVQNEIESNFL